MFGRDIYYRYASVAARLQRHYPLGRNIYDHKWDVCVILDSARADCFERAAAHSATIDSCGRAWSVGSITTEWLANTFSTDHASEIAETTLVSATPHTTTVFDDGEWLTNQGEVAVRMPATNSVRRDAFDCVHELWRTHAGPHGAVPPQVMRDATLEAAADTDADRVVAHWLQPHEPFIAPDATMVGGDATARNVWDGLQSGRLDHDTVWQSYIATLRYAMESLEQVLQNIDGRVLITADHGNAFGEWGIYGHPFAWPQPAVRRVPWVVVDCENQGTYTFKSVLGERDASPDRDAQLRALGYR